ncbi:MAG: SDR family NAD(P)-dependent oxidoreductase [Parashewanella sp.]
MKSITIIGCGWFGLPLGQYLSQKQYQVFGSKRAQDDADQLSQYGINGFQFDLSSVGDGELMSTRKRIHKYIDTQLLVVNIPPNRRQHNNYLLQLADLIKIINIEHYEKVIFISSSGVYEDVPKRVKEQDASPHSESSDILLKAEQLFLQFANVQILRFAGLIGKQRHPVRYLSGKTAMAGANKVVNLVHLTDCINSVVCLLENTPKQTIYNVCSPDHPTKKDYYTQAAKKLQLVAPEFKVDPSKGKLVDGSAICDDYGFIYQETDLIRAC